MAYNALSTARQDFNSFGSSLASIQQNAQDDANSNVQNSELYQQAVQQLHLEGPQALAFGGMQAIQQGTELIQRLKTVGQKIKELPSTLTGIASKTAGKLTERAQQARNVYDTAKSKVSGTLEDVQAHASSVAGQAKDVFKGATSTLQDSANLDELKTNFTNFKTDLTGRLAKANDIIDSNIEGYSRLSGQAKLKIEDIQGKMDALKSSATGELTGLAKDQYDALSAKLPDLLSVSDKANAFISKANETRDTYAKSVSNRISQEGEKAKAQFSDISSKLSPEELQTQLGAIVPKTGLPEVALPKLVPSEILPSASESGQGFFNRIGDYVRTKTSNTLQPATDVQEHIQNLDPELMGAGGRGFISSANERVTAFTTARPVIEPDILPSSIPFADDVRQATSGLGDIAGRGLGVLGDVAGLAGGVSAVQDAARGQFNVNDAANTFFGVEAGKSLGESAVGGIKSAVSSLGEQLSGAGGKVVTSLSQTADQGLNAAKGAITGAKDLVSGAVKTGSETAGAAVDVAKGAASDVAEGVAEASSAVVPIVGEAVGIGLAGYQIYEGFKDLFTHPSAPTPISVPTVANISQGFQSGV
tara:strand:- start:918 stop:2687 length:1770 start_codon:yes stop_codon:yes gene_type:complete